MKPKIAQLLRRLANRLDPPDQGFRAINYRGESMTASTGGVVVEAEGQNLWHPDQHGNVIEVEPDIIRKARRDGTLSDM